MAAAFLPHIGLLFREDYVLTSAQGSYALTGQNATLVAVGIFGPAPLPHLGMLGGLGGNTGTSAQGTYAVTGQAASLLIGYKVAANVGFYTLTGQAAIFNLGGGASTGGDPAPLPHIGSLLRASSGSKTLTADTGLYGIFGSDGLADFEMSAAQGTYAVTGQDAGLRNTRTITADQGTYAFTGQDATFAIGGTSRVMTAESGTYALTGYDAGLYGGFYISGEQGFYALLGQAANLTVGVTSNYVMLAETGDYQVFGNDADLIQGDPVLWAECGTYTVTGFDTVERPDNHGGHHRHKHHHHKHMHEIDESDLVTVTTAFKTLVKSV